jgi:hypothetical protein
MRLAVIVISLAVLAGCDKYREVDNQVLCDPKSQQAYYIIPGVGTTSHVQRNASLDSLCKFTPRADYQK